MTYLLVDAVVLTVVALIAGVRVARVRDRRGVLAVMAVTAAVVGVFTAVFDSLMIAAGLFSYAPEHLIGLHIGLAPVEDFAYVLAAAVLLPALWWGPGRGRRRDRAS